MDSNKYIKYKQKYLHSKNLQIGGTSNFVKQTAEKVAGQVFKVKSKIKDVTNTAKDAVQDVTNVVKDATNVVKDTAKFLNKNKKNIILGGIGLPIISSITGAVILDYIKKDTGDSNLVILDVDEIDSKDIFYYYFEQFIKFFKNKQYTPTSRFITDSILVYHKKLTTKTRIQLANWLIKSNNTVYWYLALSDNAFGNIGKSNILNTTDSTKLLHLVCQDPNINPNIVNYILQKHKPDINEQKKNGKTPAILAIEAGNINILKILVIFGANLEITDNSGKNAYDYAAQSNNKEIIQLLNARWWAEKSLHNIKDFISLYIVNINTTISTFEKNAHDEMLNIFIGFKPKDKTKPKIPSANELILLLECNKVKELQLMKNPNLHDMTALTVQTKYGTIDAMKILLKSDIFVHSYWDFISLSRKKVYINNIDDNDNSALYYAIEQVDIDKVELLIENGAIPNKKDLSLINEFEKKVKSLEKKVKSLEKEGAILPEKDYSLINKYNRIIYLARTNKI